MANTVVLLLGSNLDNRLKLLEQAVKLISTTIGVCVQKSAIYESEPWGFETSNWFYNQVITIETTFQAHATLQHCQDIENQLGRVRNSSKGYTSRTIDIDLLFFNEDIINSNQLIIPHPRLHERNFTLLPLMELMPEYIHPEFKKTIEELHHACSDKLEARKLPE